MNLKVLWIVSSFPAHPENGKNLYLWHPVAALQDAGIAVVVLHTPPWKANDTESIQNSKFSVIIKTCCYLSIPRHYFRALSNFFYLYRVVPEIEKLNKLYQFDVIHAHGEISGLAAVAAAKKLNIASVVTIHGIDTSYRMWKGLAGKMFKNIFNQANKILYVGESLKKYFQSKGYYSDYSCIIYNGFRLPAILIEKSFKNNNDVVNIISVSNLHEGKGVDLTLLALGKLKALGIENWTYTIIGSGDQKKLCNEIIMRYALQDKVEFKGDCTHNVVYDYLRKSDIFCLPSYREAFGIAYVEAMAHGLLTIGVEEQGPQAFITHNKTGLLVKPQDINELANILAWAITHQKAIREIANRGQEYVYAHFTWKQHAKKLIGIYKEVVCVSEK